jgi:hypothetical protein
MVQYIPGMYDVLFWIYLVNAILLITHEIDSAYWKEWELFKLPGGATGFIVLHFPLIFIILYGLLLVYEQSFIGLIFSLLLCLGGLFAFIIHTILLKRGGTEFRVPVSIFILVTIFILSIMQIITTIGLLIL